MKDKLFVAYKETMYPLTASEKEPDVELQKELQNLKTKIDEFSKVPLTIVNQLQLTKEEQIKRIEIES